MNPFRDFQRAKKLFIRLGLDKATGRDYTAIQCSVCRTVYTWWGGSIAPQGQMTEKGWVCGACLGEEKGAWGIEA